MAIIRRASFMLGNRGRHSLLRESNIILTESGCFLLRGMPRSIPRTWWTYLFDYANHGDDYFGIPQAQLIRAWRTRAGMAGLFRSG
jgi:hypothetical protein